jgi:hypothetical protein
MDFWRAAVFASVVLVIIVVIFIIWRRYAAICAARGQWLICPVAPEPDVLYPCRLTIGEDEATVEYTDGVVEKINGFVSPSLVNWHTGLDFGTFRVLAGARAGGAADVVGLFGTDYVGVRELEFEGAKVGNSAAIGKVLEGELEGHLDG